MEDFDAAEGGPIAPAKDGDMTETDIPNRKINLQLTCLPASTATYN